LPTVSSSVWSARTGQPDPLSPALSNGRIRVCVPATVSSSGGILAGSFVSAVLAPDLRRMSTAVWRLDEHRRW
jgi:hypothetical protein